MISGIQMFSMLLSAAVSIGLPLALLILWRRKTHAPFSAAVCGAAIFFVFALVLEQLLHRVVLTPSGYVVKHTWAFVLYGSFAAGIFEETGRFVGFKLFLKKHREKEAGVMYGIGHGGMESILLCGVTMIAYLVLSLRLNSTGGNISALPAAFQPLAAVVPSLSVGVLLLSGVERIIAVFFHIGLSMLVFWAANRPGKLWMYPLAILLHAGLDTVAVLYQRGILRSIYWTEVLLAVITAVFCVLMTRRYRRDENTQELLKTHE